MKQKKMIMAALALILALCVGAIAWPWGQVGINVDDPTEQLDVGGNIKARKNIIVGDQKDAPDDGAIYLKDINIYAGAHGEYHYSISAQEETIEIKAASGQIIELNLKDPRISFLNPEAEAMLGASYFSVAPCVYPRTGVVFRVNNTIWTNTP